MVIYQYLTFLSAKCPKRRAATQYGIEQPQKTNAMVEGVKPYWKRYKTTILVYCDKNKGCPKVIDQRNKVYIHLLTGTRCAKAHNISDG